ncbi:MAG: cell wall hydrolase [Lachnospiraceae bacterium]|nr:cell wall hydrolase [Lachnospiraceae bacterium]
MAKIKRSFVLLLACAILAGTVFTPFKAVKAAEDENENVEVVIASEQPDEKPENVELTDEFIESAVKKHCKGLSMLMLKIQTGDIAAEKSSRTDALVKRDADKKKKTIKRTSTSSSSKYGDGNASGILKNKYNEKFTKKVTEKEYEILCRIVQAEAGDQDVYGRILVANVILNRVNYEKEFPNDIEGVVFEKKQFSPISNGAYYRVVVDDVTREAVDRCLSGEDYSDGALYFFMRSATAASTASWFDTLTFICKYGCHEFFKD